MNDHDTSRAAQDVIATTDSYGGPVSQEELAEVYLAPSEPEPAESGTTDTADTDSTDPASR